MKKQLVYIQQFKELNPELDWLHFRSWEEEEFNELIGNGLHQKTKPYKEEVIEALMIYQTLFKLCQNDYWAELLVVSGLKSIIQIANCSKEEFLQIVSTYFNTNLPLEEDAGFSREVQAEAIYQAAVNRIKVLSKNGKANRFSLNLMIA